jgi:hypothetical protein
LKGGIMRIRKHHREATSPLEQARPRRYRRIVLLGAGTLGLVIATTSIVAALAGKSSPAAEALKPSVTAVSPSSVAAPAAARHSSGDQAASSSTKRSTGISVTSSSISSVLADGTYSTYVRKVDVEGARITVDVIQVFEGEAAANAAIEDGTPPSEAQYLYVHVRNENPRLRMLPVARDLSIQFVDTCEAPANQHEALKDLAEKTTPFNTVYYYEITVRGGAIRTITQHLAIAAC